MRRAAKLGVVAVVLGALVFVPAIAGAAPASAEAAKYVTHTCTNSTKTPHRIILACGDGGALLRSLSWSSWGGNRAAGRGKYFWNDCKPYCFNGTFHKVPAKVRLSRARPCWNRGGRLHYRRATIRFTHKVPRGQ